MERVKKTFRLIHKSSACIDYYFDEQKRLDITTIEAMGLLISRIAAQLKLSDDGNELCEYRIEITKIS